MLPYLDALAIARGAARARAPLPEEEVPLASALGRVCSRPLVGREAIPPFDNSSMDGYALASAQAATPRARLVVLGTVMAGDDPGRDVETGGAWRVMTGAPIPRGCDAVVPVERARELDGGRAVELLDPVSAGDFVRRVGKDFEAGAAVCPAGTRLGARHLLALAAVGIAQVPARRKPRVALIATGKELVAPDARPKPGQIRDASSAYLAAAIPALGADFDSFGVVADDVLDFRTRFERILSGRYYDVVLTTGAVSMGVADFVPGALKDLGAEILFHKAAIRPGKPGLLARIPNGPVCFGLPGNPISTVVGLRFFVEPFLRELLGRPHEVPARVPLAAAVEKPAGLRCFFKARRAPDGRVEILPGQWSFQIHSLLEADGWAVLPEEGTKLEEGDEVDFFPLAETLA